MLATLDKLTSSVDPWVASEAARLKKKLKAQMAADKRREKRRKLNES